MIRERWELGDANSSCRKSTLPDSLSSASTTKSRTNRRVNASASRIAACAWLTVMRSRNAMKSVVTSAPAVSLSCANNVSTICLSATVSMSSLRRPSGRPRRTRAAVPNGVRLRMAERFSRGSWAKGSRTDSSSLIRNSSTLPMSPAESCVRTSTSAESGISMRISATSAGR